MFSHPYLALINLLLCLILSAKSVAGCGHSSGMDESHLLGSYTQEAQTARPIEPPPPNARLESLPEQVGCLSVSSSPAESSAMSAAELMFTSGESPFVTNVIEYLSPAEQNERRFLLELAVKNNLFPSRSRFPNPKLIYPKRIAASQAIERFMHLHPDAISDVGLVNSGRLLYQFIGRLTIRRSPLPRTLVTRAHIGQVFLINWSSPNGSADSWKIGLLTNIEGNGQKHTFRDFEPYSQQILVRSSNSRQGYENIHLSDLGALRSDRKAFPQGGYYPIDGFAASDVFEDFDWHLKDMSATPLGFGRGSNIVANNELILLCSYIRSEFIPQCR